MSPQLPDVSVTSLPEGAFLLDVREDDEWAAGRAEGAVHLPLPVLAARVAELPRDVTIACVCRGGGRSAQAAAYLGAQGFSAVNVHGGMKAWAEAGLPMVTESGMPPQVI